MAAMISATETGDMGRLSGQWWYGGNLQGGGALLSTAQFAPCGDV